jgi:Virulence-associated protein E-like domain
MTVTLADILARWPHKKSGKGYRGICPAHGGDNPTTLEITEKDGKIAYHCYARDCSIPDILRALGLWEEPRPRQRTNRHAKRSTTTPPVNPPQDLKHAAKEICALLYDSDYVPNSTLELFGAYHPWILSLHNAWRHAPASAETAWQDMRQNPRFTRLAAEVDRQSQAHADAWRAQLFTTKNRIPYETLGNITLGLQHLAPWATDGWYDEVRDRLMMGETALDDQRTTRARLDLETLVHIPMRSRYLVDAALSYLCHQHPRDLLREWIDALPPWDQQPRLENWLTTYAHAPHDAYGRDVSRLLPVSMVVRALMPGCQYRFVVIFEGPEDAGKSELVRALASPDWYRELSHDLEGKEAHMRIKSAWVAELAELASFRKTAEARLKSFFTLREDSYVPKFSNYEVVHKRRTVFIGTHNPDGDNTYMTSQTGNTRYLPIAVRDINLEGFEAIRTQLFAEAFQYFRQHPQDWWRLSSDAQAMAQQAREERRQRSVYEDDLGMWLEENHKTVTWWEEIANDHLRLDKRFWTRQLQMEVSKGLRALDWEKQKRERIPGVGLVWPWRPGPTWLHERTK